MFAKSTALLAHYGTFFVDFEKSVGPKKKYVCLRSPDPPYFSAADPNLFLQQLFHPNFC